MGRRKVVLFAPSPPHARQVSRRPNDHCRSSGSEYRSYSHSWHELPYPYSCVECDRYNPGDDESCCERGGCKRRSAITRKIYHPSIHEEYCEPEVYYSTTLRTLRDRENARINGKRSKRSKLSVRRDLSPTRWSIWELGDIDESFDEMHRILNEISMAPDENDHMLWTDEDCAYGHNRYDRHDDGFEHRLRSRLDGRWRSRSDNVRGDKSRSWSKTRIRDGHKTAEDSFRSRTPVRATHYYQDGTVEAVMSGARDPRDSVVPREWRRAALSQDNNGVWYEYGDSDEGNVVRTLDCENAAGRQWEDPAQRTLHRGGKWHDRAQPVGFVEELDWS